MATANEKQLSAPQKYRQLTARYAENLLEQWVGPEKAREAAGRISVALAAAAASARNPADIYACTHESIARCVAIAALTNIMPGSGSTSLAYLIPRRDRKDEPPQLRYEFSHRGLNALARRTGQTMIPIPISHRDEVSFSETGETQIISRDIDNPPMNEDELRGVLLIVKELSTGVTICREFVPKSIIHKRRDKSDSYQAALRKDWLKKTDPWHAWYIEQCMKTAMHYGIARAWCVIDDAAAVRAAAMDNQTDMRIEQQPTHYIEAGNDGGSQTDRLADSLGVDPAPADNGEESQEPAEPAGEESQEPPELGDKAQGLLARLNDVTTKKSLDNILGEARQLVTAGQITDAEMGTIEKEHAACAEALKK